MITTIWNGTSWSNNQPDASIIARIQGTYSTTTHGDISCYSLFMDSGSLTITTNTYVRVQCDVYQQSGFVFNIQSDGEFALYNPLVDTTSIKLTIQRALKYPFQRLDYYLLGDPISGKTVQSLSTTTLASRFYTYNPFINLFSTSSYLYNAVIAGSDVSTSIMEPGTGIFLRTPNSFPTAQSTWTLTSNNLSSGKLNAGEIRVKFQVGTNNYSFMMICNPYTAKIDLRKFYNKNPFIQTVLYRYFKTNGAPGTSYTIRENFYSSTIEPGKSIYLDPFEGVFITIPSSVTEREVIFTPDMMILGDNYTEPDALTFNLNIPGFALPVCRCTYEANKYPRLFENVLSTDNELGLKMFDGYVLYESYNDDFEINLKVNTYDNVTATITLSKYLGKFIEKDILIYDDETQTTHDLKSSPYTFNVIANYQYDNRFKIIIE